MKRQAITVLTAAFFLSLWVYVGCNSGSYESVPEDSSALVSLEAGNENGMMEEDTGGKETSSLFGNNTGNEQGEKKEDVLDFFPEKEEGSGGSATVSDGGTEACMRPEASPKDSASAGLVSAAGAAEQSFVSKLPAAVYAEQILVVSASGSNARVTMHEKGKDGCWREILSANGFVGYEGVGEASEAYTRTPKGTYALTRAFGVLPDPGTSLPYIQVDASHYWVDDPASVFYNQFVSTNDVQADWSSAEHLINAPTAYAYALVIDYNLECIPGKGSAFFLHCGMGQPTYGCVAISKSDMLFVLKHISENAYIVIGTEEDFE